jgi:general secretion pathway protein D
VIFAFFPPRHTLPLWLSVALLAAGCATQPQLPDPIEQAESSIAAGRYEEGLGALEALANSGSKDARTALLRDRSTVSERLVREAKSALDAERLNDAETLYNRLLAVDANNAQARIDLLRLQDLKKRNELLAKSEALLQSGDLDGAERKLKSVLLEDPANHKALELIRKITERQNKKSPLTQELGPEFKKTISLEFRDAPLKDIFDAIWHASGINFILDREVKSDVKASIFVRDVTIEEAIEGLLMTQQLAKKVVSAKTLFIYPKTPQKTAEYQDTTVRNFFLAYADVKQMQNLLKTILKIKDVYIDEKRNLLVVRDTQDTVDMAEKLIRAHDQPEPEVMLALDVVEITKSKLKDIGITFPTQVGLSVSNPITVQQLGRLSTSGISIGFGGVAAGGGANVLGTVNLTDTHSDANLLANPRIRVRNREKAKIHIGDRLPVVTTTSSSTSTFVGQTVNYLDVGIVLEVEPQVMLDNDVVVKLNLEVSTASQDKINTAFYDVGTRNTTTVLTIHDGETQVLAGLVQNNETNSGSRLPGLADLPLIGRMFTDDSREHDKSEIILAITPRVLSNLVRPSAELTEYSAGSDTDQHGAGFAPYVAPVIQPQPGRPNPLAGGIMSPVSPATPAPAPSTGNTFNQAPSANPVAAPPAPGAAPPTPAATPAPASPATGVIPMSDFATPPGVGSAQGAH